MWGSLDYIVIPKNYKFNSFKCKSGLSDYKALIAGVEGEMKIRKATQKDIETFK